MLVQYLYLVPLLLSNLYPASRSVPLLTCEAIYTDTMCFCNGVAIFLITTDLYRQN